MFQEKRTNKHLKLANCAVLEKWLAALYHQAVKKLESWNLLSYQSYYLHLCIVVQVKFYSLSSHPGPLQQIIQS